MPRRESAAAPRAPLGRDQFIALLSARFPEVAAQIDHIAEGLIHLEMATLQRATNAAIRDGDLPMVQRHFGFVDEVLRTADDDVTNAVVVSYLEDLDFRDPLGAPARKLLPPRLRTEHEAILAYLERLFAKPGAPESERRAVAQKPTPRDARPARRRPRRGR